MYKLRITGDLGFEFWQDIPDYEGIYQASTYGRVKGIYKETILKPSKVNGYHKVTLCKEKIRQDKTIHRLIALTFIPNYYSCPIINHKDECKTNNRVENLEWCTQKYNINYGSGIQRSAEQKYKPICQFDIRGALIHTYNSAKEACDTKGFSRAAICNCLKNKTKTAYGYIWRYA